MKSTKRLWCKHYSGMFQKTKCDAGVEFATLEGHGTKYFYDKCPCFGPDQTVVCEKSDYPTIEEREAEEEEIRQRFSQIGVARDAIVDACGGPWSRGDAGQSGAITCPVCSALDGLSYSRSGYNGHIHARCSTDGCVSWME